MPWGNDRAARQRSSAIYGSPEYRRNRAAVLRRAGGRCEQCGHRHTLQVDHIIPVSQGGSHTVANLQALCAGEGSCKCHERKTATEGGGFRSTGGRRTPRDPRPTPRTNW